MTGRYCRFSLMVLSQEELNRVGAAVRKDISASALREASGMATATPAGAPAVFSVLQGQSNAGFLNTEIQNVSGGYFSIYQPIVQSLTGVAHTALGTLLTSDPSGGLTIVAGTPTYATDTINAALWLDPHATCSTLTSPATWVAGAAGAKVQAYLESHVTPKTVTGAQAPGATAAVPVIFIRAHSESDSQMAPTESTFYQAANRRFVLLARTWAGKSAVQMPVFYMGWPTTNSAVSGAKDVIRLAWTADARLTRFNAHWGSLATYDVANRVPPVPPDGLHTDLTGDHQDACRLAISVSRWMHDNGHSANDLSWLPRQGPRIVAIALVAGEASALDVFVRHDGGTDIIVPAAPRYDAFQIMDGPSYTVRRNVTAITRLTSSSFRLTLDSALVFPGSEVFLDFCQANDFYGLGSLITDNFHTDAVVKPAAWSVVTSLFPAVALSLCKIDFPLNAGQTIALTDVGGGVTATSPPPAPPQSGSS